VTNVLLLGSNFASAQILTSLLSQDNTNVTVVDRRDPLVIRNMNQDVFRIVKNYCYLPHYTINYRDLYEGTEFGDKKRGIFLSFLFKDWVHEDMTAELTNADIIIHSGSIYDTIYAQSNQLDTMNVNVNGMFNILRTLKNIQSIKKKLFIYMSSINVYGDQSANSQEQIITEDETIPNPKSLIDFTLFNAENMVKSLLDETDYMILRLGTLCGYFTPHTSLVTSAVTALLDREHTPEYTVYNGGNSIELLDINDFGMAVSSIYSLYKEGGEKYEKAVNQVYNIKAEEVETKNVRQIVEIIMTAPKRLPAITKEHGIKGISNFSLKPPKITEAFTNGSSKPFINFGKPVSTAKANNLLNFLSMKPLVYSLLQHTPQYVLQYILADVKSNKREALKKMFYLPSTPTPETVDEIETPTGTKVNKKVQQLVEDVTEAIANPVDDVE
jgi:nucleoside-diphosphate-sugar epimerase